MKYCIKCGHQLDDNAKFCTVCGTRQPDSSAQHESIVDVDPYSVRNQPGDPPYFDEQDNPQSPYQQNDSQYNTYEQNYSQYSDQQGGSHYTYQQDHSQYSDQQGNSHYTYEQDHSQYSNQQGDSYYTYEQDHSQDAYQHNGPQYGPNGPQRDPYDAYGPYHDPYTPYDPEPVRADSNSKGLVIVGYLLGWIGFFIVLLAGNRKDPYLNFHLNQILVVDLFELLGFIPILGWIWAVVMFVFWLLTFIGACQGKMKPAPLIGNIHILDK